MRWKFLSLIFIMSIRCFNSHHHWRSVRFFCAHFIHPDSRSLQKHINLVWWKWFSAVPHSAHIFLLIQLMSSLTLSVHSSRPPILISPTSHFSAQKNPPLHVEACMALFKGSSGRGSNTRFHHRTYLYASLHFWTLEMFNSLVRFSSSLFLVFHSTPWQQHHFSNMK